MAQQLLNKVHDRLTRFAPARFASLTEHSDKGSKHE
jgi:hypothetical protein